MSGKRDLVADVAPLAGLSQAAVEGVLDMALASLASRLRSGEGVTIKGFGTFKPAARAARTGRNPRTGEDITVPAKRTVKFKPLFDLGEA